jgi:hypothetical protein
LSSPALQRLRIRLPHLPGSPRLLLTRPQGFFTHITLHHIIEHVDFAAAGVRREKLFRVGTDLATKALLKAHSVSVLLPHYRSTLNAKYSARNVLLGTHGTFASIPSPPDFTKRGNPDLRILAIGHWGTYKRLGDADERLPKQSLEKVPNARLIVAGANHHTKAGYWESIRDAQPQASQSSSADTFRRRPFLNCFSQRRSLFALRLGNWIERAGPSGMRVRSADRVRRHRRFQRNGGGRRIWLRFYEKGDPDDLAEQFIAILKSPELQRQMAEHNFAAGLR